MNESQPLVFRVENGPRYQNLWVLVLIAALIVLQSLVAV